jgi:HD-GYP domain-containing protein (c-di-GMP phosphodiesterase class II)
MRLFKQKKGSHINNYVTAIDGNVVARKGDSVDQSLLSQLEEIRPPANHDVEPIKNSELYSNLEFLLNHTKYAFITDGNSIMHSLLRIFASMQFNSIVMKELAWMRRYSYHYHHSLAVALLAARMTLDFGKAEREATVAALCGLTHDFGITRVPEGILHKISPLDEDEKEILHEHPIYGHILLVYYGFDCQEPAPLVAYGHHEDLLGNGYPRGIVQENMISRCIQICDMYDALISSRPFRPAMTSEKAEEVIAGKVAIGEADPEVFALLKSYVRN